MMCVCTYRCTHISLCTPCVPLSSSTKCILYYICKKRKWCVTSFHEIFFWMMNIYVRLDLRRVIPTLRVVFLFWKARKTLQNVIYHLLHTSMYSCVCLCTSRYKPNKDENTISPNVFFFNMYIFLTRLSPEFYFA